MFSVNRLPLVDCKLENIPDFIFYLTSCNKGYVCGLLKSGTWGKKYLVTTVLDQSWDLLNELSKP